jgi:chemotaxis protein CheX
MTNAANSLPTIAICRDTWNPLLELSAREVFEIMLSSKLEKCTDPDAAVQSEFTAMVGLAGQLCGVLSIRCSAQAASLMASKMLGISPIEAGQESWDAIGEIANMVAGNFKAKLSGMGNHCMLSVPTVITGADYRLRSLADGATIEVGLTFEEELISFTLELHS